MELDMVLQLMNYKGNLTDLGSRMAGVGGEIKIPCKRQDIFSKHIIQ
jgi:hypothetical protein